MGINGKPLGVVIGVDGTVSQIGMYNSSNTDEFIWNGELLKGPRVGGLIAIAQNDIIIIAKIFKEQISDMQNNVKTMEYDNRFSYGSIKRFLFLKTQGVIEKDKFSITSQYVPMIGNQAYLVTKKELKAIYGISLSKNTSICIGHSLLDGWAIDLPINHFFASHIGIFGNTGSGKSNTLYKLHQELFRTKYLPEILSHSKFFIIDFNGEYIESHLFDLPRINIKTFEVNTRGACRLEAKIPVKKSYLFDPEILAILLDAKPATQIPFLRSAMRKYNNEIHGNEKKLATLSAGLLVSLLKNYKIAGAFSVELWYRIAESIVTNSDAISPIKNLAQKLSYGNAQAGENGEEILKDGELTQKGKELITQIEEELRVSFTSCRNDIKKLYYFLEFEKIYYTAWNATKIEYLNPLFKRMESAFRNLDNVISLCDDINDEFASMNVISLVHANQEMKRLIPMLISKMIYDTQKDKSSSSKVNHTVHLIIDEAHNILSNIEKNNGDNWQDFRLSVFEEIIKEGRKFGFYLTVASQRPADISPTILSQIHNFFIHRLVNDNDLIMLSNTMPTLDRNTYQMIPSLGKGEAIITGTATSMPILVKVDRELDNHPTSDDIDLISLWKESPR